MEKNKGGCKTGRKGQKPMGGCLKGKKTPASEKKKVVKRKPIKKIKIVFKKKKKCTCKN